MKATCCLVILCFPALAALAQPVSTTRADQLYREKKFPEALAQYQKAAQLTKDPVIGFNLGDAYFRNAKFEEAGQAFTGALAEGNDAALRQRAFYNKGVSLSKESKLEESVAAYKSALLLNPADSDARINLQKALLELKKKQDSQKDQKEDNKSNNQKKKDNPPPAQSKLTKKQVEQLLKALDQREQQVQQKMMQNRSRALTKPDKDW